MSEHIRICCENRGVSHYHLLSFRSIYCEKFSLQGCRDTWKILAVMEEITIGKDDHLFEIVNFMNYFNLWLLENNV